MRATDLYEMDVGKHAPREILNTFLGHEPAARQGAPVCQRTIQGSIAQLQSTTSSSSTQNWRLAGWRRWIKHSPAGGLRAQVHWQTPGTVVINEALEIAVNSPQRIRPVVNGI
jgi:hypothetical protein